MTLGFLLAIAAGPAPVSFEDWFLEKGVAVAIARQAPGPPWIRGEAELEAPASAILDLLSDYGGYGRLFSPHIVSAALLGVTRDGAARVHLVWRYPFPFRNRDAVLLYESRALPGGGARIGWIAAAASPGDPRQGVRLERVEGATEVTPTGPGRCRVTYTYLGELGGRFPRAAEEAAWRREPVEYIRALRRALGIATEEARP